MPHLCFQPDASLPRRRSAHLGEPEASSDPYPLRLGELVFLACFALASSLPVLLSIFIKLK